MEGTRITVNVYVGCKPDKLSFLSLAPILEQTCNTPIEPTPRFYER